MSMFGLLRRKPTPRPLQSSDWKDNARTVITYLNNKLGTNFEMDASIDGTFRHWAYIIRRDNR